MQCKSSSFAVSMLFFIIALLACCAPAEPPDITIEPASRYPLFLEYQGLQVAIEPFLDRAKNELYFGMPMLDQNIVPLLVVAENHSDSTVYFFERKNIALEPVQGPKSESPAGMSDSSLAEHGKIHLPMNEWARSAVVVAYLPVTSASLLFAGAGVLLVYKDIAGGKKESMFRHNLVEKELMDKTLYPGTRSSGFIYIRMPTSSISDYAGCRIVVTKPKTQEAVVFRFRLTEGGKQ